MNKFTLFAVAAALAALLALAAPAAGFRSLKTDTVDDKPGNGPKTNPTSCPQNQWYSSSYPDNKLTSVASLFGNCYLESPNKKCQLVYQCEDGNLVLYRTDTWEPLWASNTQVPKDVVGRAEIQVDGNFVVKFANSTPYWSSGPYNLGLPPYTIELTNKCEVYIYDSSKGAQNLKDPIWTPNVTVPNWGNY